MLSLYCDRAGKAPVNKGTGLAPEALRVRPSQKCQCPFRINFNLPDNAASPYVSHVVLEHSHPLYEKFDKRYLEVKLKPSDPLFQLAENLSLVGNIHRRQIEEVCTLGIVFSLT